jgi:hypothetical protein
MGAPDCKKVFDECAVNEEERFERSPFVDWFYA